MRSGRSLLVILALTFVLPPRAVLAAGPVSDPWDSVKQIIDHRNLGELDAAAALARQEFAKASTDRDLRRTIAREGKAVAVLLFERDRGTPERIEAAIEALCWAVDTMRIYEAELMESERDHLTIPSELTRLEVMATAAAAPCAPAPSSSQATPAAPKPEPIAEGPRPAVKAPISDAPRRSRARIGVGVGLMVVSTGFAAGMTAAFVGRRANDERLAALADDLAHREDPLLTPGEQADALVWDGRHVRLGNTAVALGTFAAVSLVAAVVVLVVPPTRTPGTRARVRPSWAGVHITF